MLHLRRPCIGWKENAARICVAAVSLKLFATDEADLKLSPVTLLVGRTVIDGNGNIPRGGGMRTIYASLMSIAILVDLRSRSAPKPYRLGRGLRRRPVRDTTNEVAAVAIGGKLLAPGGSKQGKSLTRLDEYDPVTDRWRERAPLPQPLDHIGVAVVNGKLYAFAGSRRRSTPGPPTWHSNTTRRRIPGVDLNQ